MVKDMTEQEKIEFAQALSEKNLEKRLKNGRTYIKMGWFWGIGGSAALAAFTLLNIGFMDMFLPMGLATLAIIAVPDLIRGYKTVKNVIREASGGKVSYREYKKLLKSGELEQWAKGNTKGNVVEQQPTTIQPSTQDGGVQLSAEEVAVLKKLMEKQGISNVDDLQTSNQQPTTKTPTDNGRNS